MLLLYLLGDLGGKKYVCAPRLTGNDAAAGAAADVLWGSDGDLFEKKKHNNIYLATHPAICSSGVVYGGQLT